uniref:Uncharacterized protein n=1 Tax=Myotis myotis TaxID=51298 RepID=A0A7J7YDV0_MYOMY|nr:hypothetical protein mMyoMyo1_011114 [Myotis myotis]
MNIHVQVLSGYMFSFLLDICLGVTLLGKIVTQSAISGAYHPSSFNIKESSKIHIMDIICLSAWYCSHSSKKYTFFKGFDPPPHLSNCWGPTPAGPGVPKGVDRVGEEGMTRRQRSGDHHSQFPSQVQSRFSSQDLQPSSA